MASPLNKVVGKSAFPRYKPSSIWPLPEQLIGIELELEGVRSEQINSHRDRMSPYWSEHNDPSLRDGGLEYVLSSPMMGEDLDKAISYFFKSFTNLPNTSYRASTHIHLNMLQPEDTVEVLRNMTALYYGLEDSIFTQVCEGRRYATYCAPFSDRIPDEVTYLFSTNFSEESWSPYLDIKQSSEGRQGRYYAYNMKALQRFGTIEFRHFPSIADEATLRNWIILVMELKRVAVELDKKGVSSLEAFTDDSSFDLLAEAMPVWGKRLLHTLDRGCAAIKVQSLYKLLPIKKYVGAASSALSSSMRSNAEANDVVVKMFGKTVPKKGVTDSMNTDQTMVFWDRYYVSASNSSIGSVADNIISAFGAIVRDGYQVVAHDILSIMRTTNTPWSRHLPDVITHTLLDDLEGFVSIESAAALTTANDFTVNATQASGLVGSTSGINIWETVLTGSSPQPSDPLRDNLRVRRGLNTAATTANEVINNPITRRP